MKLSKLDLHIEILKTIDQRRLPQLTIAQDGANVNLDQLREQIDFLMKQGLVYQRKTRKSSCLQKHTARHKRPQLLRESPTNNCRGSNTLNVNKTGSPEKGVPKPKPGE